MRQRCRQRSLVLAMCLTALSSCLLAAAQQQQGGEPAASAAAPAITIPQVPAAAAPAAPAASPGAAPSASSPSTSSSSSRSATEDDDSRVSCRVYVVNNTDSSATFGHVQSSLNVLAAADVMDVNVVLQVQHPDVAALEITLSAASTAKLSKSVMLKTPAYGTVGGADMVQTIFSDFAPSDFPKDISAAPYSSVYRPAQPFKLLTAGSNTAAGLGGSKGVWTLAVTDKATGELSRRPLKLTGWELWLCGESSGALFAPDSGLNATSFDGPASASVNVVKKSVVAPSDVDVDVVIKSGYRKAQIEQDPVNRAITNLNAFLAKELSHNFDAIVASVSKSNPQLAQFLKGALDKSADQLRMLPGVMGYQKNDDGDWVLPSSEVVIRGFLDTLTHCYYDIYWCWENTGLRGNFALDFVNEWNARAGPVAAGWASAQEQWVGAVARFEDSFPELNQWSDVLFYSVIDTLYDAAAIDAIYSVGEAWTDTAIRLAIWASPIRFAVNPRAFITQTLSAVADILRTVFGALRFVPYLIDDDNNNDVPAIMAAAQELVNAATKSVNLALDGLNLRAQGLEKAITQNAGGLARSAAGMNKQLAERLKGFSPELGKLFEAASDPLNEVLLQTAETEQQRVANFLRQQSARMPLRNQLDQTLQLMGDVAVQFTSNAANVLVKAANEIDDSMPGPSLRDILRGIRNETEGILSDARDALERLLPIPEIEEANALLSATVDGILELLDESVSQVLDSEAAAAVREQLFALSRQLTNAQEDLASVANGIIGRFPGPLLNSTLGVIGRQVQLTTNDINGMFDRLATDFPNLNPETFINQLQAHLEELLGGALDQVTAFIGLTPPEGGQAADLVAQLPDLLVNGLTGAIPELQDVLGGLLPASVTNAAAAATPAGQAGAGTGTGTGTLQTLQQGLVSTMNNYVNRVNSIADTIPTTPPAVSSIVDNIASRSDALSKSASELLPAISDAASTPQKLVQAGLNDLNSGLSTLLEDMRSQQNRSSEIARQVTEGPLADILAGINGTLATVGNGVQGALDNILQLLPDVPNLREVLDTLLGPAVDALDGVLQQASQAGLQALQLGTQGLLTGLAPALEALTQLLINAQWQLAGILGAAVQAGEQLDAIAGGGIRGLDAQLLAIETSLANVAGNITQDVVNQLTALAPPVEVIEQLITPLAAALNNQLGVMTGALNSTSLSDLLQGGLPGALQELGNLATGLLNAAGSALGMPEIPGMNGGDLAAVQLPSGLPVPGAGGNGTAPPMNMPALIAGLAQQLQQLPSGLPVPGAGGNGTDPPMNMPAVIAGLAQQLQQLPSGLPVPGAGGNGTAPPMNMPAVIAGLAQQLQQLPSGLPVPGAGGNGTAPPMNMPAVIAGLAQQLQQLPSGLPVPGAGGNGTAPPMNMPAVIAGLAQQLLPGGNTNIQQLGETPVNGTAGSSDTTSILQQLSQLLSSAGVELPQGVLQNVIEQYTGLLTGDSNSASTDGIISQIAKAFGAQNITSAEDLAALLGSQGINIAQLFSRLGGNLRANLPQLGRRLLTTESFSLQLPVLGTNLLKSDGQPFDAAAFMSDLRNALQNGLGQYANTLVASVHGLRGASQSEQLRSIVADLGKTVQQATTELRTAMQGLPQGPVFQALISGDGTMLQQLEKAVKQLAEGKVSGELLKSLSSTLGALAGSTGKSGLMPGAGDVVGRLSQQLVRQASPHLSAAQALAGLRSSFSSPTTPTGH